MGRLVVSVFKFTDSPNMYSSSLEQPGTGIAGRVHSTRQEERLAYVPGMEAHKQDRDVVLVYKKMLDRHYERRMEVMLTTMLFIFPTPLTLTGETCSKRKGTSVVHLMPDARKSLRQLHSW